MLFSPCFVFCCSCFFSAAMEVAARFIALDHQDLPFVEYYWELCRLAAAMALDDATILSLYWHGANSHRPVDLPDTTGLRWREGILRCLESVLPQVRISSLSSAVLPPPPRLRGNPAHNCQRPTPSPLQSTAERSPPPTPLDGVWHEDAPSGGGCNVRPCFPVSCVSTCSLCLRAHIWLSCPR